MARGMSTGEVAAHRALGESIVKTHVDDVFAELAVRDRAQAVVVAVGGGLAGFEVDAPGRV